jgi:hypothetical protein
VRRPFLGQQRQLTDSIESLDRRRALPKYRGNTGATRRIVRNHKGGRRDMTESEEGRFKGVQVETFSFL